MKTPVVSLTKSILGLGVGALLCASLSAQAASVTYNIDSSLSSLTLSGNAFGLSFTPQSPGSAVTFLGGTITADLSGGVLTFTGGSAITFLSNPTGPFSHLPGTGVNGVQNYGVTANGFVSGFGVVQINGAYRDLTLDITAGTAVDGAAPSLLNMSFTGGSALDYGIFVNGGTPFQAATSLLNGVAGLDTSVSLVSLVPGSGLFGDTLTLPVTFHTVGSNRNEFWTGTIVAVVPEPTSLALLGVGLLGFAGIQMRRARRGV